MIRLTLCVALLVSATACGPMTAPMATRLDAERQAKYDEAWERMLASRERLDRQSMLDVILVSQSYQMGVDTLYLRSEKRFSRGTVVMEISFDRLTPDDDRFLVRVLDPEGRLVRSESYDREMVERSYEELFAGVTQTQQSEGKTVHRYGGVPTDELASRRAIVEEIWPDYSFAPFEPSPTEPRSKEPLP